MLQIVIFLLYIAPCYLKFSTNIYCSYNQQKMVLPFWGGREAVGGAGQSWTLSKNEKPQGFLVEQPASTPKLPGAPRKRVNSVQH